MHEVQGLSSANWARSALRSDLIYEQERVNQISGETDETYAHRIALQYAMYRESAAASRVRDNQLGHLRTCQRRPLAGELTA